MDGLELGCQDPAARDLRALDESLSKVVGVVAQLAAVVAQSAALLVPLLRVDEVAERLGVGVGERAVRKMMDRGEIPWAWAGRQRVVLARVWLDQLAAQAKDNQPPACAR